MEPTRTGSASEAILAVSRLLSVALDDGSAPAVHGELVREARAFFAIQSALLVVTNVTDGTMTVLAAATDANPGAAPQLPSATAPVDGVEALAVMAARRLRSLRTGPGELAPLLDDRSATALVLALGEPTAAGGLHQLVLASGDADHFVGERGEVAAAFANAAAAVLAQVRLADDFARKVAQQSALTRAAKNLNESLDLTTLLERICQEAAAIFDADIVAVYRGSADRGVVVESVWGLPPETIGYQLAPGAGLSGKALQADRAMFTNDYQRIADLPPHSPFARVQACVAAPMHWDGGLHGVLSVGFERPHRVGEDDVALLETFAELAAVACRNASTRAGLALAARTDGLTGCVNHAALHETLGREIERAERGATLSFVLLDLDDFKQVNEKHGHLMGDEVLRQAGRALRTVTRPYDVAARYGGDEFALVIVDADEAEALAIASRAIATLSEAVEKLEPTGLTRATGGVAQWTPGLTATELVARADAALLHGKQGGRRGVPVAFSSVPLFAGVEPSADKAEPESSRVDQERGLPEPPPMPSIDDALASAAIWRNQEDDRLRKRTRQLALANALGARLAAMTDVEAIMDAAVEELHSAFGYFLCAVIRIREDGMVESAVGRGEAFVRLGQQRWCQSRDEGLIGRCLRERRPVVSADVSAEPEYRGTDETRDVCSELVVPLWVGGELWGAINIEEPHIGAFDRDDVRLVETVADQTGSALRSAFLFEQLERAYMGTAEALAAALEAKDSYTAHHAHSIVSWADAVGRRLGMAEEALRDLRFGAVFHDIGKIAVPEAILNKRGPLTPGERAEIERHTVVGEQILAPVDFLSGVRVLVRHEHERWDGAGYPDGLSGETIPLGARIILACDAYHAMTSDRPYRRAMSCADAAVELRTHAGSQFDARVVDELLAVLAAEDPAGAPETGLAGQPAMAHFPE